MSDNIEFENIINEIDKAFDSQSRKLYNFIVEMGNSAFNIESPLYKYRDTDLIERLIAHFESIEEYEKCEVLKKASWRLKGVI